MLDILEKALLGKRTLLLDVFDTAVHRSVMKPTDIFSLVTARLFKTHEFYPYSETLKRFPVFRKEAEEQAREKGLFSGEINEVTLDEIYVCLGQKTGLPKKVIDLIKETEMELELKCAYPDPVILSLYNIAKGKDIEIIFVSDMYLSSTFISDLLRKCGYDGEFVVEISCESRLGKSDGRLYKYVLDKYSLNASHVLMVGDNEYADCIMASEKNIMSYHFTLKDNISKWLSPLMDISALEDNDITSSLAYGIAMRLAFEHGEYLEEKVSFESAGRYVFGPFVFGFLLFVLQKISQIKPERVIMFARDMYLFDKLFAKYPQLTESFCEYKYSYFNRRTLILPSFQDINERTEYLMGYDRNMTVREMLTELGLDEKIMHDDFVRVNLKPEDLVANVFEKAHKLIKHSFEKLHCLALSERDISKEYALSLAGDAENIVLVDIGWVGNVQFAFSRLVQDCDGERKISGIYAGLEKNSSNIIDPEQKVFSWFSEEEENNMIWGTLRNGGIELLEFALSAPYGTVTALAKSNDDMIVPVFEECGQLEKEYMAHASLLQLGIEEYVDYALKIVHPEMFSMDYLCSKSWSLPFCRFVNKPTNKEAELFGNLTHSETSNPVFRRELAPRVTTGSSDSDSWNKSREQAFWKAGFDARN